MEKTTGELIKAARKKAGLTQAELGAKLNITPAAISQFEKPSSNPTFETLEKISNALGCKISELCEHYDIVRVQPDITKIIDRYDSHKILNDQKTDNDFLKTRTDSSYEHAYSFASSAEECDKLQDAKQIELESKRTKPFTVPLSQTHSQENDIYVDPNLQRLYETAMQKAIHHEELTEEEEQVIIGIPGQLRHKGDSYENSYSFANSEEELNKILKQRQKQREELLLNDYRKLNEIGQSEARKRVSELTEIPRYTKPDEPPQD